jgi:hypothetical protein
MKTATKMTAGSPFLASALIAAILAASPEAGASTHIGQKIEDHVVLTLILPGAACPAALHRIRLDGSVSEQAFRVREGRVLVVTDVEWSAFPDEFSNPGDSVRLQIMLSTSGPNFLPAFQSRAVIRGAAGVPGSSEQLTTGFAVGSGTPICALAGDGLQSSAKVETLVLRGYLIAVPRSRDEPSPRPAEPAASKERP